MLWVTETAFRVIKLTIRKGGKWFCMGNVRNIYKILVGKPKKKKRYGGVSVHGGTTLILISVLDV